MSSKSKFILLGLLLFGVCIAVKINANSATGSWRYRMTVTVSTPEGDKTGSSVREVTAIHGWQPFPDSGATVSLKGEAVVVDLGKRGQLFALLTGYRLAEENATDLPGYVLDHKYPQFSVEGIKEMGELSGYKELDQEWYPHFVHFKDITNPKTVENVMTMGACHIHELCVKTDNFEKIFGKGVHIKSVTIEMTKDDVTKGIEKWIPWLPRELHNPGYLGNPAPPYIDPTKTFLTGGEFSEGIIK